MAPLICLLVVTGSSEIVRLVLDSGYLASFADSIRVGLAAMFMLTGSAHFNKMHEDLVRMVPEWVPHPAGVVLLTGVIELIGALALLVPPLAPLAALGFILFLMAIFPANAKAARSHLTVGGRKTLGLLPRGLIQAIFIGACVIVARS